MRKCLCLWWAPDRPHDLRCKGTSAIIKHNKSLFWKEIPSLQLDKGFQVAWAWKKIKVFYVVRFSETLQYTAKLMQLSPGSFVICLQLPVSSWYDVSAMWRFQAPVERENKVMHVGNYQNGDFRIHSYPLVQACCSSHQMFKQTWN